MKEFILLFRSPQIDYSQHSPAEWEAIQKKWMDWAGSIANQGKMVGTGGRLPMEGKVLRPGGVITDGPFVEIRERLGGFLIVKAESLEEATTLAHGCPALEYEGSVEIRPMMA